MKISIVTPVLNGRGSIGRTLESVQRQDYVDWEHVVIDGGSTDGTLDLLQVQDPGRVRWISERDEGIADAFNKGIRLSTGDVVGIINADDRLCPGAFGSVARAFASHPNVGVVFGSCIYEDVGSGHQLVSLPDADFARAVRHRLPLKHPTMFVRRSTYQSYGMFDTSYRLAMDYELVLRFHRAGVQFLRVEEPLAIMQSGGANEAHYARTIRETRDISIRYGYPPMAAHLLAIGRLGKGVLRTSLQRTGMGALLRWYRTVGPRFRSLPGPSSSRR